MYCASCLLGMIHFFEQPFTSCEDNSDAFFKQSKAMLFGYYSKLHRPNSLEIHFEVVRLGGSQIITLTSSALDGWMDGWTDGWMDGCWVFHCSLSWDLNITPSITTGCLVYVCLVWCAWHLERTALTNQKATRYNFGTRTNPWIAIQIFLNCNLACTVNQTV